MLALLSLTCLTVLGTFAAPNGLAQQSVFDTSSTSFHVASQSQGILNVAFDPSKDVNSSLYVTSTNTDAGYQPNWLIHHQTNVYSISRTHYPNNSSESGGLFAFSKLQNGTSYPSKMTRFSMESSDGLGGVAIDISPDGQTLAAANIDGSTVSIHPITPTGEIEAASYVFTYNLTQPGPGLNESQIRANPHHAAFDPTGDFLFVADRGSDRLYVYAVDGPYNIMQIQNITLESGTGPRHLTFKTYGGIGTYMYLVSELDNTVRVFALDRRVGSGCQPASNCTLEVTLQQTISSIGKGSNRTAPNNHDMTADIAISNDGRFAYVANRNTLSLQSDNIAVFAVDPAPAAGSTHLTYLGRNDTNGKIPRHFALSRDEQSRYVAVANQYSQTLAVFERDPVSGFLVSQRGFLSLGKLDLTGQLGPICVLWN